MNPPKTMFQLSGVHCSSLKGTLKSFWEAGRLCRVEQLLTGRQKARATRPCNRAFLLRVPSRVSFNGSFKGSIKGLGFRVSEKKRGYLRAIRVL